MRITALSLAAALLTACAGSQLPIGVPGAMPQSHLTAHHSERGGSWMLPEAKSEDLLYVATPTSVVYVYSYPELKSEGVIQRLNVSAQGLCSDPAGNVYVPTYDRYGIGTIFVFAHGAFAPKSTLADTGEPTGCSVDPTTGNLAVSNLFDPKQPINASYGDVAIYKNAQGSPAIYSTAQLVGLWSCGYDALGNLFADNFVGSFALAELPKGGSVFRNISVDGIANSSATVQWDGTYITVTEFNNDSDNRLNIYRLTISGSVGTIVGTTTLKSSGRFIGFTSIHDDVAVAEDDNGGGFGLWHYPQGGGSFRHRAPEGDIAWGVTLSVSPEGDR